MARDLGFIRRSATSARNIVEAASRRGLTRTRCLSETGIEPQALDDPRGEIEPQQEFRLMRNVLAALEPGTPLGLEAGLLYRLTTFGLWGYALMSSPTFRHALELGLRYVGLTAAFSRISAEYDQHEFRMVVDDSSLPLDLRRFIVECETASQRAIPSQLLMAEIPIHRAEFRHADPGCAPRYREVFGCEVHFGCERNLIAADIAILDRPLPLADPQTAAFCEQICQQLLSARQLQPGVAQQVRKLLMSRPARMPSERELADALCVVPRTLQRQLAAEGTSFRMLIDEVREILAVELLNTRGLTVEDIASRLGYAETSTFVRAFRRWRGQTPSAFRKAPNRRREVTNATG